MAPQTTARLVFFVLTCFNFGFRAASFGRAHGWLCEASTAEPMSATINACFCCDTAEVAQAPGLFFADRDQQSKRKWDGDYVGHARWSSFLFVFGRGNWTQNVGAGAT